MRNLTACAVACALAGCASLPPETAREEVAYQLVAAVDATQTLRIADEPQRYREVNPVLGQHPAPAKVAAWFALTGVAHYGITALLVENDAPRWLVRSWQIAGLSLEVTCIGDNVAHGVTPTLSFNVALDAPTIIPRRK